MRCLECGAEFDEVNESQPVCPGCGVVPGTREVWQVYPKSKSVVIHRDGTSAILASGEHVTTSLLPGFSLEIKTLFMQRPR
jgi:hypothetical protein